MMKQTFPLAAARLPRLGLIVAAWLLSGCSGSAPDANAVRLAIESHFAHEIESLQQAANDQGRGLELFNRLAYQVEISEVSGCKQLEDDTHWQCRVVGELEIDGERHTLNRVLELVQQEGEWRV